MAGAQPGSSSSSSSSSSSKAIWIGIGLSVVAVTVLLWRVSFKDLGAALRSADAVWLIPSLVVFLGMFALRAWRWSVLLGGTPFWATWHANIIGYFFNITLPLRVGEIARAYVIAKNADLTMTRALSAAVVERLVDLASVVLLFAWFAQQIPMQPGFTRAATIGSIVIAAGVVAGVLVVAMGERVERALAPRLERLGKVRAEAVLSRLGQIRAALRSVGSVKNLALSLVLTVAIWGCTIAVAYLCMRAFIPSSGLLAPGLVVVMANLGGALPSAPGGLGIVQGFATSALVVPFGIADGTALAFVLVWSLGMQLVLVILGFVSIGRVGLSFREIRAGATQAPKDAP